MNFGKYTLYLAYGLTTNGSMFLIAFGMVFGKENKIGWEGFWSFAIKHHKCLNSLNVTIITPLAHQFFAVSSIQYCGSVGTMPQKAS